MISDWIIAKFKGIFGETQTLKIKVTGWNMWNPLRLVIYLVPIAVALVGTMILMLLLKFMFSRYILKQAKESEN
jgi:hypothetical protein